MSYAFTADQVRAAEAPLLAAQDFPDQLMQAAAHAVFETAQAMLAWPEHPLAGAITQVTGQARDRVLVLAGKGGNGGDALYAGAELAMSGHPVDAWLVYGSAHEAALTAFQNAGGTVLSAPPTRPQEVGVYTLAIDGITGIGGTGSLGDDVGEVLEALSGWYVDILSVDVPSGISADTGQAFDNHVTADVTITFGGWRLAHGLAPECGEQLCADIGIGGRNLSEELRELINPNQINFLVSRATELPHEWPEHLQPLDHERHSISEPGSYDDKYTGGVVGIRAGSGTYPGAALLATASAVHATPSMVRYAGPQALEVVRAHPEVVVTETIADAGRVQTWVFGPGAGTHDAAADELADLLEQDLPVLIDADGLTLLAERPHLREQVIHREAVTVLTPHDGEFSRLREACGLEESDRLAETLALANELRCTVVRKGRATIVALHGADSRYVHIVDAGTSWAATPGSGDVLAGLLGAHMAHAGAKFPDLSRHALAPAVTVHAMAAKLAATTEFGEGPTTAGHIAAALPAATAKLLTKRQ